MRARRDNLTPLLLPSPAQPAHPPSTVPPASLGVPDLLLSAYLRHSRPSRPPSAITSPLFDPAGAQHTHRTPDTFVSRVSRHFDSSESVSNPTGTRLSGREASLSAAHCPLPYHLESARLLSPGSTERSRSLARNRAVAFASLRPPARLNEGQPGLPARRALH